MAISKIIYKASASATPEVWMDATTATATAGDIISPKTAMLADGVVTQGTGSGGGIDMPTITVTWNDDMDTIVSVVCDKTFSECETYCNNGIYNCVLIQ